MLPIMVAAAALLPVTLMVAVAVLRGAVGLTNRFLLAEAPLPGDGLRSAWYTETTENELPEPGLMPAIVPTVAAALVAVAVLFGYGFVAAVVDGWPFISAIDDDAVAAKMAAPAALLAVLPVFLLFRTRAMAGLMRTSFPRAAAVVAFELLIWGMLGATGMAVRAAAGYGPGLTV